MDWHCKRLGHTAGANRYGTAKGSPRYAAAHAEFYTDAKPKKHPPTDTARSIAFLRAYTEISGSRFPMQGVECSDGKYIWPDRAVMREMIREGFVQIDNGWLELTDKGRCLIWKMP